MTTLAVIPARGGSKGIAQKNLQIIGGVPLVAWSIRQAQASGVIDYIHVSTDDLLIQKAAKEHGANCDFLRPSDYAGDYIGTTQAILSSLFELKTKGIFFDNVVELQPTYCFRGSALIKLLVNRLDRSHGATSIITGSKIDTTAHPEYAVTLDAKGNVVFGSRKPDDFARQRLSPIFACQGVVFVSKVSAFLGHKTFYIDGSTELFAIENKLRAFDINDAHDLTVARHIAKTQSHLLE